MSEKEHPEMVWSHREDEEQRVCEKKKVYLSETKGLQRRGMPLRKWKAKVKEYISDKGMHREGGLEQAKRECLEKERWRLFCHGYPFGGSAQREQGVRD